ncbi:Spy0128 family protein [Staphylococcus caprae]|uniref:Spy0128 family protein n=1 Tax=Staphylococcus caprae TaxID=29380 RepID=UPI0024B572F5|nr:FctA domain-containing protein [Staphylococcus caprae]MDI9231806.1 FctA domain-containing protein [Staphylococcus caprae]
MDTILSIDHMSEAAKSTGIDTTNYVRVYAETLKPDERNMEHLDEYIDIPGYPKPFKIQPASEGDAAGMLFAPRQVINGVQVGSGGNFRLQNFLARIKPADYYYTTLDPVEVTLKVHNIIKGEHNQTPGEFTFNIEAGPHSPAIPDASQSKTNAEDGSVTFDKIAFTKPGTYTYTITENKTNLNPNYDTEPLRVTATITVIEEDEMLKANVVYSYDGDNDGNQAFTNYYVEPQPFDLNIPFTKSLTGRNLKDGEFHFALKNDKGEVLATGVNDAQGAINFTFLDGKRPTYTNADVGHTFKYNVEEVPSNEERMTSDPMKAVISVNVLKFENTELHALTVTSIAPLDTEFNNTYTPLPATAKLEFNNVLLTGKPLTDGEFQFTLSEGDHVLQTVTNQNGKVTFDHLTYNSEGSHTYTVKKVPGTDTNIDYDSAVATVTVNVTKNPITGNYEAVIVNPDDTKFTNYYVNPIALSFDFSKELLVRPLKADEFDFVLKNEQGKEVARTKNTIDGKVIFNNITFKNSDVGTHTYTVEELQRNNPNITYDSMKANVKISITKEGHILQSNTELLADTEFNNTYIPLPAIAKLEFNNVLTGKPLSNGEFQFTLSEGDHVLQTVSNQNGKVIFDHLTYDSEGSHTYTIKELQGTDTNIDYDPMVATVTVNVVKNHLSGNYEAVIVNPNDTEFNNYYVSPVSLSLDFSKKLIGRPLKADEFDFVLKDEQGKEVARTKNTIDGKVIFNNISFKNNDIGTYTYTVEELQGNDSNITYDHMKAKVKITITKEGHILISKTELPADIEFNNTFTPVKTPTPNKVPVPKPQKTSEHKVEYDKKAKCSKEIELIKETKFNKYNEVHKVASLPDTGISDKNNDKTLFATIFAGLGSLILLGRRKRKI